MRKILITGKMHSGKDYFARALMCELMERGYSVLKYAFAWKLKDLLHKNIYLKKEGLTFKINNIDSLFDKLYLAVTETAKGISNIHTKEECEKIYKPIKDIYHDIVQNKIDEKTGCREILQKFGTEVIRNNYDKEFWVKWVKKVIKLNENNFDFIIITDYRFQNEELENSYKIKIDTSTEVRSYRSGVSIEKLIELSNHDSERFIDTLPVDKIISNDEDNKNFKSDIEETLGGCCEL